MDLGAIPANIYQTSGENAVSLSVLKIAMNSDVQATTQMAEMMNNIDADTNIGMNIDTRV